jgi:hypothetical protein
MLNKLIIYILSSHLRYFFQRRIAARMRIERNINQAQSNTATHIPMEKSSYDYSLNVRPAKFTTGIQ